MAKQSKWVKATQKLQKKAERENKARQKSIERQTAELQKFLDSKEGAEGLALLAAAQESIIFGQADDRIILDCDGDFKLPDKKTSRGLSSAVIGAVATGEDDIVGYVMRELDRIAEGVLKKGN
jgi:hypothetical protein